jgi:hypothetical protein
VWQMVEETRGQDLAEIEAGLRCPCGCGRSVPGGFGRRYATSECHLRVNRVRRARGEKVA